MEKSAISERPVHVKVTRRNDCDDYKAGVAVGISSRHQ